MESAKRTMQSMLEDMLWMVAGSSWQVVQKEQVLLSLVLLVAAIGASIRKRSGQKLSVTVLLPHQQVDVEV